MPSKSRKAKTGNQYTPEEIAQQHKVWDETIGLAVQTVDALSLENNPQASHHLSMDIVACDREGHPIISVINIETREHWTMVLHNEGPALLNKPCTDPEHDHPASAYTEPVTWSRDNNEVQAEREAQGLK